MNDHIKHLKKMLFFVLKLAVSVAFISFIFSRIDVSVFKESLKGVRVSGLAMAFFVLCCGAFAGSASWYNIIRANRIDVSYFRIVAMHWSGMFFNSFLPSTIGGDLYKGWMLVEDQSSGVSTVVISIFVDRVLNFSLLILIGLVALAFLAGKTTLAAAIISLTVFASTILIFAVYHWKAREGSGRFIRFLQELLALFRMPRRCVAALCIASLSQGCKIDSVPKKVFFGHLQLKKFPTLFHSQQIVLP